MKKHVILSMSIVGLLTAAAFAGSLNPPAAPTAGTMKTLDQVEARIPILGSSTPLATIYITQSGSYYLTGNRNCAGYGIIVQADNVTIDLNGYSLIGPGTTVSAPNSSGIGINNFKNCEIRNGTITNFKVSGVLDWMVSSTSRGHRVMDVRVIYNGDTGIRIEGKGHTVERCTSIGNGNHGIDVGEGCRVTGNIVYDNQRWGILTGSNCLVNNNVAYENNRSNTGYSNLPIVANCTYVDNHAP